MNLSQLSVSLGSVAKLGAKVPLLGQGGEAAATGRGGGGSNGWEGTAPAAGFQQSHHPRGAARHIPSSAEEGSFPAILRVSRQKLALA